jgi:hypothetical protein
VVILTEVVSKADDVLPTVLALDRQPSLLNCFYSLPPGVVYVCALTVIYLNLVQSTANRSMKDITTCWLSDDNKAAHNHASSTSLRRDMAISDARNHLKNNWASSHSRLLGLTLRQGEM